MGSPGAALQTPSDSGKTHLFRITGLLPDTAYRYVVFDGSHNGTGTVLTKPISAPIAQSYTVYGDVTYGGLIGSAADAIVYAAVQREDNAMSEAVATLTDAGGGFSLAIGTIYTCYPTPNNNPLNGDRIYLRVEGADGTWPTVVGMWDCDMTVNNSQPQNITRSGEWVNPVQSLGSIFLRNTKLGGPIYSVRATPFTYTPSNIEITNLKEGSFSVTWTTEASHTGYLVWGETYYFKIISNSIYFGDDGSGGASTSGGAWSQATINSLLPPPTTFYSVYGMALDAFLSPAVGTLAYLYLDGGGIAKSTLLSTAIVDANGWFYFDLVNAREDVTGNQYAAFPVGGVMHVRFQGASDGVYPLAGYNSLNIINGNPAQRLWQDGMLGTQDFVLQDPFMAFGANSWYYDATGDVQSGANNNIDIERYKVAIDPTTFYTYIDIVGAGTWFGDAAPDGDVLRILIDSDNDASTGFWFDPDTMDDGTPAGYHVDGIGADYLVEVFGNDSRVQTAKVYQHSGAVDDWTGFGTSGGDAVGDAMVSINATTDTLLVQVDKTLIGSLGLVKVGFMTTDGQTSKNQDFGNAIVCADIANTWNRGALVEQDDISGSVVVGASTKVLMLNVSALGQPVQVSSISVELMDYSTELPSSLTADLYHGGAAVDTGVTFNGAGQATFDTSGYGLLNPLDIGPVRTLDVRINEAGTSGNTIRLTAYNVTLVSGYATLRTQSFASAYIQGASTDVAIDGMFADWWTGISDIESGTDADAVANPNVDIEVFNATSASNNVSMYAQVAGLFATGIKIPTNIAIDNYIAEAPVSGDVDPPAISDSTVGDVDYKSTDNVIFNATVTDNVGVVEVRVQWATAVGGRPQPVK
jgi:hypothetical protein